MNRYTVIQPEWVEDQLAELWLNAVDKQSVTAASHQLDQELRSDAENKGEQVDNKLRKLVVGPLWVYYTVHPDDCIVKVWSILPAKS
jgi:hypothetical protein